MIADFGIDLPIISSATPVEGSPPGYPACDVALFLSAYNQPSQDGATFIYAHARKGMFLPLLEASRRDVDRLRGTTVTVYTQAGLAYSYEITTIERHATDLDLADDVPAGQRRLIVQTSEGPDGSYPKLLLAGDPTGTREVSLEEATPRAKPRACG